VHELRPFSDTIHKVTMVRKPTGVSGVLRVESGGRSDFLQSSLPTDKAAIEAFILEGTLRSLEFAKVDVYHLTAAPKQLEQNNFDFELSTATGTEFLDLVEFAPIGRYRGYEGAPNKHIVGEIADAAWEVVKGKSKKYGLGRRGRVHLLIYITDFRFLFSDSVFELLTLWCARRSHGFRSVVYYAYIDDTMGLARVLHPSVGTEKLSTLVDERRLRLVQFTNFDPRKVSPTPDGEGVMFDETL
jgi:hypothetical protein